MPYTKISELPDSVKVLPESAQRQFLQVANSALDAGDSEETAFTKAWGVVKRKYEKGESGEWKEKMSDSPRFLINLADSTPDGWKLYMPFRTIHHGIKKDFTVNDGIEMVTNFKQHVPDYDLPINSLHRDEYGVFGVIADLRVSERGVEWMPNFRDGAVDELKGKGYRYASPEVQWHDYTGVFDGKTYSNVALGIAITPRPRLGRATLVFDDGEWQEYDGENDLQELHKFAFEFPQFKAWVEEKIASIEEARLADEPEEPNKEQVAMDENEEVKQPDAEAEDTRLQEKNVEITALQEEKAQLQEEREQLKTRLAEFEAAKAAAEQVALEERAARRKMEFAETAKEIAGLPEADFGDELMWLNDADATEDKAHYNKYLNVLKALGNQEKAAQIFSEAGHDGNAAESPEQKFESLIKRAMSERGLTRAEAVVAVARENGALYAEYDSAVTKNLSD